jgi:hypothetical protein
MKISTEEFWLPVVGYKGYYEVSNFGNIRSVYRVVPHPTKRFFKNKTNGNRKQQKANRVSE